jgi:hypothetical protein
MAAALYAAVDTLLYVAITAVVWPLGVCVAAMLAFVRLCSRGSSLGAPARKHVPNVPRYRSTLAVVDIAGIHTELLTWSAEGPAGSAVILVVYPGNPGACDFYAPFAERVHELSGRRICVVIAGHASHSSRTAEKNGARLLNLREQVAHKNATLLHLAASSPGSAFVLAGHSVGAYMALETLRVLPPSAVLACIGLFPTLSWIGSTLNGQKLTSLFRFGREALWLAAHVARALPTSLQHALVRANLPRTADPDVWVPVTATLLHPQVAYNTLWMALHEMREILALDEEHFSAVQGKVHLYFGPSDAWVRPEDVNAITAAYPAARSTLSKEAGDVHAFVLFPESVERVAQYVWGVVEGAAGRARLDQVARAASPGLQRLRGGGRRARTPRSSTSG